jgi:hypothetical protein
MKTNQSQIRISNRRFSILCIAGLLFILSGCGVKWWYGKLDYLLRYRVDQYFDITNQQKDFITQHFGQHLVWHRYEGLPTHIEFLAAVQKKLADGITHAEIGWFFTQYREQNRLIINRLSDDAVQFLTLLNVEQIDHFSERLTEENEELAERLQMSREERLEKRAEKTLDSIEDWLGSLSDEQEAEITKLSLSIPDSFGEWYQKKIQRQQHFISILRKNSSKEEIRQGLHLLMLPSDSKNRDPSSSPIIEMIMTIDRLATPAQRQHVIDEIQAWIDDLIEISQAASA